MAPMGDDKVAFHAVTGVKPLEHSDAVDRTRCSADADDNPPLFHSTGLFLGELSQVCESMPGAMVGNCYVQATAAQRHGHTRAIQVLVAGAIPSAMFDSQQKCRAVST